MILPVSYPDAKAYLDALCADGATLLEYTWCPAPPEGSYHLSLTLPPLPTAIWAARDREEAYIELAGYLLWYRATLSHRDTNEPMRRRLTPPGWRSD